VSSTDPRLGLLLEQIIQLSTGDLTARGEVSEAGDEVDAVIAAVNMLAEDFAERERQLRDAETLRSQAEAEQRRLTQHATALERSNAALSEFALVASHDLQEPLRLVAGYTELLEQRFSAQLGPDGMRYLNFAADGARRMQQLIVDLLAYCQVGAATLALAEVDLQRIAENATHDLRASIAEAGGQITILELPRLPGDARQLYSLFLNLIGNAIKYRGDDPPQVTISATRDGNHYCFAVADNGIGIEPRFARRIFDVFQRLHSRSKYAGTGIGLSICRKVVEAHGGQIWVEPGKPLGSIFRFTLPAD
jgi:light-regulated signal transduction histidine kinase (bacteriophytochrome)